MSQNQMVYEYMERNGSIDALRAVVDLNVFRLSARIADLKKAGVPIETEIKFRGTKHWAEYKISRSPVDQTEERQGEEVSRLPSNTITNI